VKKNLVKELTSKVDIADVKGGRRRVITGHGIISGILKRYPVVSV